MKTLSIIILLITSITYGQFEENEIERNIQNSNEKYRTLFLNQNFEELSNYASPKLIEYLKSKQDFVYLLTELTKNAESIGASVTDISFGKHSIIIEQENELQCSIPFKLEMEDENKIVHINSGLALVSLDKGQSWYFTFQVQKDNIENNQVLGLNENIVIPPKSQKVIPK